MRKLSKIFLISMILVCAFSGFVIAGDFYTTDQILNAVTRLNTNSSWVAPVRLMNVKVIRNSVTNSDVFTAVTESETNGAWSEPKVALRVILVNPEQASDSDKLEVDAVQSGTWTTTGSQYVLGTVTMQMSTTADTVTTVNAKSKGQYFYTGGALTTFVNSSASLTSLVVQNMSAAADTVTITSGGAGTTIMRITVPAGNTYNYYGLTPITITDSGGITATDAVNAYLGWR